MRTSTRIVEREPGPHRKAAARPRRRFKFAPQGTDPVAPADEAVACPAGPRRWPGALAPD